MYHEDLYDVNDYDEDIHQKELLLEEAKQIPASADWKEAFPIIQELKKKWKRISYWESAYEDQLAESFDDCLDVFYKKRKEGFENIKSYKEDLIAQAEKLSLSEEWNKASDEMNQLMQQWKSAGVIGKEEDDALWEAFQKARQVFFDRKKQHWEEMQTNFEHARQIKQELIEKAASLRDCEDWKKTSEQYRKLMDEWKAAGSAGKAYEDQLWNAFQEHRQAFYDRRNAHYDELHEEYDQKYEAKRNLVNQAKEIAESQSYTREHTSKMKELGVEWKKIGSCGREREDEIWAEFRSLMDAYFDGLKQWNEQRHLEWRQRMQEARRRKQEMIQQQKRQIKYMQDEIVGLLGQKAIDDMQEQIEDRKEFILQLEEELADIEAKLEEK